MIHNFLSLKKKTVVGLAPMDGITDCAFRQIVDEVGKPDILFTEFINVEGILHNPKHTSHTMKKHKTTTPQIVQLFGSSPYSFSKALPFVLQHDFAGIDINMGCTDKAIVAKGGGAALIKDPERSIRIIRSVQEAVSVWNRKNKKNMTVSIKTRLGYNKPMIVEWLKTVLQAKPDFITIHGRTAVEKFKGRADWNEIERASLYAKKHEVYCFGNGDVASIAQAREYGEKYHVDGVLIARAVLGNPWVFTDHKPSREERFVIMKKHSQLFLKQRPDLDLKPMRKHLLWYCKGLKNASFLKKQLSMVSTMPELERCLEKYHEN